MRGQRLERREGGIQLEAHVNLPKDDDTKYDAHGFICPFWVIEFTDDPLKVNMEVFPDLKGYDQTRLRCWEAKPKRHVARNIRAIAENEKLFLLKQEKDSSKNLEVISRIEPAPVPEEGGEASAKAGAPAKRRRVKGR